MEHTCQGDSGTGPFPGEQPSSCQGDTARGLWGSVRHWCMAASRGDPLNPTGLVYKQHAPKSSVVSELHSYRSTTNPAGHSSNIPREGQLSPLCCPHTEGTNLTMFILQLSMRREKNNPAKLIKSGRIVPLVPCRTMEMRAGESSLRPPLPYLGQCGGVFPAAPGRSPASCGIITASNVTPVSPGANLPAFPTPWTLGLHRSTPGWEPQPCSFRE